MPPVTGKLQLLIGECPEFKYKEPEYHHHSYYS
ncbi:hypothetical protein KQS06HV_90116 [Klebsiella quasipneumoniae subsp. similipneumoniae]|nr:hypothetical protein KQS06HV_90116 [Klebsiella quasipneumoniae subsp. similipneumoniae]